MIANTPLTDSVSGRSPSPSWLTSATFDLKRALLRQIRPTDFARSQNHFRDKPVNPSAFLPTVRHSAQAIGLHTADDQVGERRSAPARGIPLMTWQRLDHRYAGARARSPLGDRSGRSLPLGTFRPVSRDRSRSAGDGVRSQVGLHGVSPGTATRRGRRQRLAANQVRNFAIEV